MKINIQEQIYRWWISTLVREEGMILIPPSIMSPLLYVIWIGVCGGNQRRT